MDLPVRRQGRRGFVVCGWWARGVLAVSLFRPQQRGQGVHACVGSLEATSTISCAWMQLPVLRTICASLVLGPYVLPLGPPAVCST
ncbi:hypothetical protein EDB83DRAFT_2416439 [Lactarius deliciosus]|nr:hypothetical protein EDB83DRAFT_2462068 [Lactarius deliciosus]KAH9034358.1 hypothetical protein EDB83DRAFT_2416439 [Lactarius deliciosus]